MTKPLKLWWLALFAILLVAIGCTAGPPGVTPAVNEPSSNENAWSIDTSDDGAITSVTTPDGASANLESLDDTLESWGGEQESLAPLRLLRRYVNVGVDFRNGPVGGCINRSNVPHVAITLFVRNIPVTNVKIVGMWQGDTLCTGIHDEWTNLCGGPWCVSPTAARDTLQRTLTRAFEGHIGSLSSGVARMLAPQVLRKLRGVQNAAPAVP